MVVGMECHGHREEGSLIGRVGGGRQRENGSEKPFMEEVVFDLDLWDKLRIPGRGNNTKTATRAVF